MRHLFYYDQAYTIHPLTSNLLKEYILPSFTLLVLPLLHYHPALIVKHQTLLRQSI